MATNQNALPSRPLKSTAPRNFSAFPPQGTSALPPLAPGWTEHKAPTGHSYYYNATTKTSTYERPVAAPTPQTAYPFAAAMGAIPGQTHQQPPYFQQQQQQFHHNPNYRGRGGPRGGFHQNNHNNRPPYNRKPEKPDRPKTKQGIPGVEKWVLVTTKLGREFVHNVETKESLWKAPEDLQAALDKFKALSIEEQETFQKEWKENREKEKAREKGKGKEPAAQEEAQPEGDEEGEEEYEDYEDYEYEEEEGDEYEEAEGEDGQPHLRTRKRSASAAASDFDPSDPTSKRPRHATSPPPPSGPVEFTEDDIAWQLESLADEYGLTVEDMESNDLPPEDAVHIFNEMLDAINPNPYSTFELVLPSLLNDPRYTVLTTTKHRQQVFANWAKEKIAHLNALKAAQPKLDPKIPFLEFLREKIPNGTKLYWPEFRRKWKKEKIVRDIAVAEKDREKMYREYVAHVKASPAILENDLVRLLKATKSLNRDTPMDNLPQEIRLDVRYAAFPPPAATAAASAQTRESIIQKYLSGLPPAGEGGDRDDKEGERKGLSKAEQALRERERAVRRDKWRLEKDIERGREMVVEGEREIERAKMVGRKGLASHFVKPGEEGSGSGERARDSTSTPAPETADSR